MSSKVRDVRRYTVDLRALQQRNLSTGYQRSVRRSVASEVEL